MGFFVNFVMLSLLIAIMGDQYDIVQEWGREQYLYAKAGIILEYEARMSRAEKQDPKLFPEWLQLLQPKTDDSETSKDDLSMTGRVKSHVTQEIEAAQAVTNDKIERIEAKIEGIEAKMEAKMEKMEAAQAVTNEKIEGIEAKIEGIEA